MSETIEFELVKLANLICGNFITLHVGVVGSGGTGLLQEFGVTLSGLLSDLAIESWAERAMCRGPPSCKGNAFSTCCASGVDDVQFRR
jgi:hypothetical protein